ncbi:MAG: hypothetical protein HFE91_08160 [Acutalibacter sp.]|uniref:CarD family transcriptional regulator n=1 Tax=Acutalibacter sp. TaxID=1918636 RepID=UPI002173A971|nr:CarD family transcriptional regulator [Acutalibacter sp.]MCI9225428.1 hypothetical protein [Acutalibacter sp.]
MYQVGELVSYGSTGVCRVSEIINQACPDGEERLYYVMEPLYKACVISVPVDSDKVFIRPIITRDQARRMIELIPTMDCPAFHSRVGRELNEHYTALLKSYDCRDWMEMTISIHAKKRTLLSQKRKFGSVDERYLKQAEELLFGELSAALEISREQVREYVGAQIENLKAS